MNAHISEYRISAQNLDTYIYVQPPCKVLSVAYEDGYVVIAFLEDSMGGDSETLRIQIVGQYDSFQADDNVEPIGMFVDLQGNEKYVLMSKQ